MNFKNAMLATFLLVASTFARAEQHVISGHWYADDYQFAMSDEWEDVQGTWGDSRYTLTWDSYTKTLTGNTAGVTQKLEFDTYNQIILGETYCGWFDLSYTTGTPVTLKGEHCRDRIEKNFSNLEDMMAWIHVNTLTNLVTEFPEPAREPVLKFLQKTIQPFDNL